MILDIYDAMQQAKLTGTPYHTRLDLPPANDWTPPESTLEAVTGRQGARMKEAPAAHPLEDFQRQAAISEIQPQLHFARKD